MTKFWRFFGFPLVTADSDPGRPFHLAQARNNAVRQANTNIVVIADADTIPDIAAVDEAIRIVENNPAMIVWPHTQYRHIPGHYVDQADLLTADVDRVYTNSNGGCVIANRQTYWAIGGHDENLEPTWGYEDTCFRFAAMTLAQVQRLPAIIYSFNHSVPCGRDLSEQNPNRHRCDLYRLANGRPDLMRELIKK